jgi:hypothetical protein
VSRSRIRQPAVPASFTVTHMRAMLAPIVPLAVLVLAMMSGVGTVVFFLLFVALLIVAGVSLMTALMPGLTVTGNRLEVLGGGDWKDGRGGAIYLSALTKVASVSDLGGELAGRGPWLLRNLILLEDAYGGRAVFPAWGWTPGKLLRTTLREAALDNMADLDEMSYWRLGFHNDDQVKVSHLRRFV